MKYISMIAFLVFSGFAKAENTMPDMILEILLKENLVGRDSGNLVTKEFLLECSKSQNTSRYKLECADLLFTHSISIFKQNDNKSSVVLIIEDGISVENRWVFQVQGSKYTDVKNSVWPVITDQVISKLLLQQTGNTKYTANYVTGVAHSSYRVQHSSTNDLQLLSGIPDESYGTKLGIIEWDGDKFNFKPSGS